MTDFMIIEDDGDIRALIRMMFSKDSDFTFGGETESAEEGIEMMKSGDTGLIILDHSLNGEMTGLDAASLLKAASPPTKIILFTADPTLEVRAGDEPAIDAFLVKTKVRQLLPTARQVCGLAKS